MKILVIQYKMIGDVLTSSILFELLRDHYPEAELHFLINKNTQAVVQGNPFIDKFWIHTPEMDQDKGHNGEFYKLLKDQQFDIVIDVYAKLRSAQKSKKINPSASVSYHKWYTKLAYNKTVKPLNKTKANEGLAITNRVLLLEALGITTKNIPKPKIYLTPDELGAAKNRLSEYGLPDKKLLFMIGVLGSSEIKTYPLPYLAKVLEHLVANTQADLLLNYMPSQKAEIDALMDHCSVECKSKMHPEVYGNDLRSFLALTAQCDALIGNEGGAVNMAKALSVPTFSIYSPWILKSAWNSYEADGFNQSIHLSDIMPERYAKHPKKYKSEALSMYQELKPEAVNNALDRFLAHHSFKI